MSRKRHAKPYSQRDRRLEFCAASGKRKIAYSKADANTARGVARVERKIELRVYQCGAHYHLTSQL